jgi:hypothetical protein
MTGSTHCAIFFWRADSKRRNKVIAPYGLRPAAEGVGRNKPTGRREAPPDDRLHALRHLFWRSDSKWRNKVIAPYGRAGPRLTEPYEEEMSLSTENQAVVRSHKRLGRASFMIGATCIIVILLMFVVVMSVTELPAPIMTAFEVLPAAMLCAALIGIGLGIVGAADRSSRKLYPLLGLSLNVAVLMVFFAVALYGMLINGR